MEKLINRYCELIPLINEINERLKKASANFYDGGTPFATIYASEYEELNGYQKELATILKQIVNG